jgi:hypothetical protein
MVPTFATKAAIAGTEDDTCDEGRGRTTANSDSAADPQQKKAAGRSSGRRPILG